MSKFYGAIGFSVPVEEPIGSGIWVGEPTEKNYRGEITKAVKKWDSNQKVNDDLTISNTLSIISDPYLSNNLSKITYVKWLGAYWKVVSAEVQFPRIVLSIGGVYNGPKNTTPADI